MVVKLYENEYKDMITFSDLHLYCLITQKQNYSFALETQLLEFK